VFTLLTVKKVSLVILDGFYGMEGEGPVQGSPVESKLCIASTDPVKADSVGAKTMGLEPDEIGYLVRCLKSFKSHFGNLKYCNITHAF